MREIVRIIEISILSIFFICSCNENKGNMLIFNNIPQVDVECMPIPYSEMLGITLQLIKKDSLLLISDFFGDSLIHVLDVKHNIEHPKLAPKGIGPNEFLSPIAMYMTQSTMYIYERQTLRLFSFPIEKILDSGKSMKLNFTVDTYSTVSMPIDVHPLSDSMFISSKVDDGIKRFIVYNHEGKKMNDFGEYKEYWYREADIPNRVRAMYHQTHFEKHPSEKMFVAYSGHILGIYHYESINKAPILMKEFLLSKYSYDFTYNETILSVKRAEGVERGIVSVSCSSKYIYIVYNPNKEEDDNALAHQIKIINWNGNPVKLLNINKQVSRLTVDETERKGYIIAEEPEDTLMYFILDE